MVKRRNKVISFIIVLFGLTMLFVSATERIEGYIKTLSVQGILLSILVLFDFEKFDILNFIFLIFETFIVKTIFIPFFLVKIVRKNDIQKEVESVIPNLYSLIIASIIFALGFFISYWAIPFGNIFNPLYFGISFSTISIGLFIIIARKNIITHIFGYMMMENGIFLLSMSVAKEMSIIINMGVLLDIFIGIYLLGLFANKIQAAFDTSHIDKLRQLKDE